MEAQEKVFYQDKNVTVTNSRLVVYEKTYAMRNISSVSNYRIEASRSFEMFFIILGGLISLFCLTNIKEAIVGFLIGALILGVAILCYIRKKDSYTVRISSNSGEANAIFSKSKEYVQKIVDGINDAIISRG